MLSIILILFATSSLYKPPELGFSELETIEERILELENDFDKFIYQETENLEFGLNLELISSNELKSSNKYKVFYYHPDEVSEISNYDQREIDTLNSSYFSFKGQLNAYDEYVDKTKSLLKSRSGTLNYLRERFQSIMSQLEVSCSLKTSENGSEELLNQKLTYCEQLKARFSSFANSMGLNVVEKAQESLSKIIDNKQEITSKIAELEQTCDVFKLGLDQYETATIITRQLINDANQDLLSLIDTPNNTTKIENEIETLIKSLEGHFEQVGNKIANLTQLSSEGDSLLNAPKFTPQASKKIDEVNFMLSAIEKLEKQQLTSLQDEIAKEIKELNLFRQNQAQILGSLDVLARNIEERLEFFIKRGEISLLMATLKWIIIIIAIVGIGVAIILFRRKQAILQKTELLQGKEIKILLEKITDSTEYVAIRKEAVKLIYNYQHFLGVQDIKRLKEIIKKMEKSLSTNDIKVNEELRTTTEQLELRLMEKRKLFREKE